MHRAAGSRADRAGHCRTTRLVGVSFTLLSDLLACHAVATVAGFGGVAAAASDMVIAPFIGFVLQAIGSCVPVFLMVGAAYILALAVVHRLVPRRQPVRVEQPA